MIELDVATLRAIERQRTPRNLNLELTIARQGDGFVVYEAPIIGSPVVGHGDNMIEAIGSWFHRRQKDIGLSFVVDPSAEADEVGRREAELAKR